jgi:very-short-patch-repair endonuclease
MNSPEAKLWYEVLSKRKMRGYRFNRQKPVGNYIVDFYCHALQLIIEVDGESHNDQLEYDQERTTYLKGLGCRVVRYTNWDIMKNIHGVAADIEAVIVKIEDTRKPLQPSHCYGKAG